MKLFYGNMSGQYFITKGLMNIYSVLSVDFMAKIFYDYVTHIREYIHSEAITYEKI